MKALDITTAVPLDEPAIRARVAARELGESLAAMVIEEADKQPPELARLTMTLAWYRIADRLGIVEPHQPLPQEPAMTPPLARRGVSHVPGYVWTSLEGKCVAATSKAVCVQAGNEEIWLPRSCVHDGDEIERGDDVAGLFVREWIANEKDLPTEE